MIVITPYISINALLFGKSNRKDCISDFGSPTIITTNRKGVEEYRYDSMIFRFDPKDYTLTECTMLPYTKAILGEIVVTWDKHFLKRACNRDSEPINIYGFIVFLKLGIAVTGIHDEDESQLALTVFSRGAFDDVLQEGTPYCFK